MLSSALGFSLFVSIIISSVIYFVNREKYDINSQKEKMNDTVIFFVIIFIVVLISKLCIGSGSTALVKVEDVKTSQCPF